MRKTLFFIALLSLALATNAQDDPFGPETKPENQSMNELSLNATAFVDKFLSFVSDAETAHHSDPILIRYRRSMDQWALRAGLGGSFESLKDADDTTDDMDKTSTVALELGIERVSILGRCEIYYGVTGLLVNEKTHVDAGTGLFAYKTSSPGIGLGPTIGFKVNLSPVISLSTQTSYLFTYSSDKYKELTAAEPEWTSTGSGWASNFIPPVFLYFNFHF